MRMLAKGAFISSSERVHKRELLNPPPATDRYAASTLDRPLCLDLLVSSGFSPRAGSTQRDQPRLDEVVLAASACASSP
jgi:hypothetical protein